MNDKLDHTGRKASSAGLSATWLPQAVFAAEIIFGSPKKNCAGAGICKVNSPTAHNTDTLNCLNCQRAIALVSLGPAPEAVFRFVKSSMGRAVKEKYFSNGHFLVETPFRFGRNFWEGTVQYIIQPGAYPVEKTEHYFIVRFTTGNPTRPE